jgi:WD40 repeat protein
MATNDDVNSIAFINGYANILATGHQDSTTNLWEVQNFVGHPISLKLLANVNKNRNPVISVALQSIDGNKFLATCDSNSTTIWRILRPEKPANKTLKVEEIQTLDSRGVTSIVFHPTANPPLLAISSSDDTVKLFLFNDSFNAIDLLHTIRIGGNGVNSIAFNQDGTLLATGNRNNTVKLFKISISNPPYSDIFDTLLEATEQQIMSVAFDYTGQFLAAGSQDMTTKIWRILPNRNSSWSKILIANLTGHTNMVTSVAFFPMEYFYGVKNLAIATVSSDNTIKLWFVKNRSEGSEIKWEASCVENIKSDNIVKSIGFKSIADVNHGIAYFAIGLNISIQNYNELQTKFTEPNQKKSNSSNFPSRTFVFSNSPFYQKKNGIQSGRGLQNESRFFKLVSVNGKEVDGGRYELPSKTKSGKEQTRGPKDKASIAFSEICKKNNKKSECSYKFAIQETTRGSNKKVYHYEGKRVKLTKPIVLELKDKKVVIKYKNVITPIQL